MRGTDSVAVRDGRQALHGSAEQTGECLRLGLAQLRVLGGDMRHRAVVLTELVSSARAAGACPADAA